jgi:inorganic triphosphatase YgiF
MPTEIELKLRVLPAQAARLRQHPALSAVRPRRVRLLNTYYDTAAHDLRKRGVALRLRRKGWAEWVMTVKGSNPGNDIGAGGLAARHEWETPTQPGVFNFDVVTDAELREFLEARRSDLQALFSTDFMRTSWTLPHAGANVEVALDRGKISAVAADGSTVSEALCELEFELVEGGAYDGPDALFDFALGLAADLHLHPEILSKAERGYALAQPALKQPVKASPSPIARDDAPLAAFRAIALSCLAHLQRNDAGTIAGSDPEYVHQARVAIRRLRSAFRVFAPVLAPRFVEIYSPRWKELAGHLGSARDWDVFLAETLKPLEDAFPGDADLAVLRARGEESKAKAQASAAIALNRREYSELVLAFSAALFERGPPTIAATDGEAPASLRKFAEARLEKRTRAIERLAKERGKMNAERRHKLRIAFKKLRYALEFFEPILPDKRMSKYRSALASLQDLLGTLNDQATASRLIKELHPKGEPDSLTRGWIAGRTELLVKNLSLELERFLSLRKPWR